MQYWLMKTEPSTFSITDLKQAPNQSTPWEGVRNYQARNFMKNNMKLNDLAFFYHSSCEIPGIVGIVKITREAYPDFTALDPSSDYFDPKSTRENPRWFMVDIQFQERFNTIIPLSLLKANPHLQAMKLLQRGNRLSILPITSKEWHVILKLTETLETENLTVETLTKTLTAEPLKNRKQDTKNNLYKKS